MNDEQQHFLHFYGAPVNHLGSEKSPYLLQHRDNPVWWYAWGPEAFAAAEAQDKPIFLSIGYSTCYWCHVMEHDSFEHTEIADLLNRNFIAIKVDREERPDIDQIYMDVVTGLTGHGGWPMSVFLTPDRKPFWGGTFFWRAQFAQILTRLDDLWRNNRAQIFSSANGITEHLIAINSAPDHGELEPDLLERGVEEILGNFDARHGGFGRAPKFPPTQQLGFLLRMHKRSGDSEALHAVCYTLERMARGGIFDHVGGGFARYSTDESWTTPHFEKMLYDNALLAVVYLEAFQLTDRESFATVAGRILDYVATEMTSPEGGFYSAQDAGEVGEEGAYYVWSRDDLERALTPDEVTKVCDLFGVTAEGNFEQGKTILTLSDRHPWEIQQHEEVIAIREKLLTYRSRRVAPHLDDKILASWNGLMITAFARGHQVLNERRYLHIAQRAARFLREKLWDGRELKHRYRDGDARFPGYLEDYAYLIEGLIALYQSDFNEEWLLWAKELQAAQDATLWDERDHGYFFSSAPEIIVRKKEFIDGATPSGNAVAGQNLLHLAAYFGEGRYETRAGEIVKVAAKAMSRYPSAFSRFLQLAELSSARRQEVAIVIDERAEWFSEVIQWLRLEYLPHVVVAAKGYRSPSRLPLFEGRTAQNDRTTVYVCTDKVCSEPIVDSQGLKVALQG